MNRKWTDEEGDLNVAAHYVVSQAKQNKAMLSDLIEIIEEQAAVIDDILHEWGNSA